MVHWLHRGKVDHRDRDVEVELVHVQDNPDGKLKKEKMMEMYTSVLPPEKAKVFVDQIFLKFDSDKSDTIDFKVFIEV